MARYTNSTPAQYVPTDDWTTAPTNRKFHWSKAHTWLKQKGWQTVLMQPTGREGARAFLNKWLKQGYIVLAATSFSSKPWGQRGSGHVVAFGGWNPYEDPPTPGYYDDGTYTVWDPAGNYLSTPTGGLGPNGHYGKNKCGYLGVYPSTFVHVNLTGIGALAIPPTPGQDPRQLLTTSLLPDDLTSGAGFWYEDASGRRSGWLPGGQTVNELPGAEVSYDLDYPSDPEADWVDPDTVGKHRWVRVEEPAADVKLRIAGAPGTPYKLETLDYPVGGGPPQQQLLTGNVDRGQGQVRGRGQDRDQDRGRGQDQGQGRGQDRGRGQDP
jgi:hypothetical protein